MTNLVKVDVVETKTETVENKGDLIELGQWYWVRNLHRRVKLDDFNVIDSSDVQAEAEEDEDEPEDGGEEDDDKKDEPPPSRWLACVTEIGTNYALLTAPNGTNQRIHFDRWDKWCAREDMPQEYIQRKIKDHSATVAGLLEEVRRITLSLGVVPRKTIEDGGAEVATTLAVAHGVADIKAHQLALVNAKEDQLPALFKRVKEQHELMATWMKADLVAAKAQLLQMEKSVEVIDDRIFTVQLYAGLAEELVRIKKGKPAADDAKVHVFQRRHYMDEECLARYEAGGMEFSDIGAFDKWIARPENFTRLLPMERSIVAFQVRRHGKNRGDIDAFIKFELEKADKLTFLYIRNGAQLWRLSTEIDFGTELFPDPGSHELLACQEPLYVDLYLRRVEAKNIIPESRYLDMVERHEKWEKEKAAYTKWWKKLTKAEREAETKKKGSNADPYWRFRDGPLESHKYERVDKDSVYYDDVMREIARITIEHNRVATVLQGLLDRSECLMPHPTWKIWTPDGFAAGIVLVYDEARTLTPGEAPDFDTYRHRLNMSIRVGSLVIGQEDAFLRREAKRENERQHRNAERRGYDRTYEHTWYRPYGNPGPSFVAPVEKLRGDNCTFSWEREKERRKWVDNPDRPGWLKKDDSKVRDSITLPKSMLFNVSAYTPGDFHIFYDDPRARAQYLRWAPFLLCAEDYLTNPKKFDKHPHHVQLGAAPEPEEESDDDGDNE